MLADGFLERVREAARSLNQKLAGVVGNHPQVFEGVQGVGLLLGLKCKPPVGEVMAMTAKHGLLSVQAGNNVLRLAPPLIISDDDISQAVERLDAAATELETSMRNSEHG